ncbi:thiamine pyrophosphate-binding protein [Desulforegula conservatrix]|uniref:thiamine pyrophosphate-binding protein n=1 Tax=Desulforegula conservatrix TaxID=153026 RepID=UPI00040C4E3D|nr:thiamine pyrophosphate-binding protein [Desulforegula conservatrix]
MGAVNMKKTGAWLTVYALEQIGVTRTFGIPGLQNTEIYDELNSSDKIQPVLVTHEGGASFMADAVSRTSSSIGTLVIVPSAGVTHAMSGIGEAFLDGIPMLIISGGVRRDTGKSYQLHQWDQHRLLEAATKKTWLIEKHEEIVPTIYEAYRTAISGEPGPVFIEIPVEIQLFKAEINNLPAFVFDEPKHNVDMEKIKAAAEILAAAKNPGMFIGWGCRDATDSCIKMAELLESPVSTTLQGLSVFPASHPLHTGMGFGPSAVPCAENAFIDCDCLLAVGTRFAEIPTGSFGVKVPENLIHIDINPNVFNKNYPARVAIEGDAGLVIDQILQYMVSSELKTQKKNDSIRKKIAGDKAEYLDSWKKLKTDKVNPALFFEKLRTRLRDDDIMVVDDGNHTFLAAELFPVLKSKHFISPSDFNCMGYCVPAAIGAKLVNPEKQVAGIVGDGAFLMTCMEILTASTLNAGIVYFVFHDGELAQIAQGQQIPYNRKTCSILGDVKLQGVAMATGAAFVEMKKNEEIEICMDKAFGLALMGQPVIVDVKIDYSRKTRFTQGVVSTVLKRFPLGDKFRFIGRAVLRKIIG